MFEIWRHTDTGERYLVVVRDGVVNVAAGPLLPHEDPHRVLETRSNQHHNALALLEMRRSPWQYRREYTTDEHGRAVPVPDPSAARTSPDQDASTG